METVTHNIFWWIFRRINEKQNLHSFDMNVLNLAWWTCPAKAGGEISQHEGYFLSVIHLTGQWEVHTRDCMRTSFFMVKMILEFTMLWKLALWVLLSVSRSADIHPISDVQQFLTFGLIHLFSEKAFGSQTSKPPNSKVNHSFIKQQEIKQCRYLVPNTCLIQLFPGKPFGI